MRRPVALRKILMVSLVGNLLCLIYIIMQSFSHESSYEDVLRIYQGNNRHSSDKNNPIEFGTNILPMPHLVLQDRSRSILSNGFRLVLNSDIHSDDLQSAIDRYRKYISLIGKITTDSSIKSNSQKSSNQLIINYLSDGKDSSYPRLNENEAYQLNIDQNGSYLTSTTLTGVIRGLSTFVQLIEEDSKTKERYLPNVLINDHGRFSWRGLMIDVCRHWIPIDVVKRTIDAMEMSKLNVLHLHLSDDQGFRLESLVHPLLHDRKHYFTQDQMRHLIEYARQRRIRVIPEFDIPGHTTSWFVGYPNLATEPGQYTLETRWGISRATMDPTKETTYTFLDAFFNEMTKLFPDDYFHIGGDEVEGTQWMSSPSISAFIQQNHLRTKNGLQAYFNKRIEKLLKKYQKTMIGWEEIVEETSEQLLVDNSTIIHSWKSRKSLIDAVSKGYRGLLSHGYYLDHVFASKFHYDVNPISSNELWLFNDEQLGRILGGEACMWTEYVSEKTFDSRVWPRVLAVAERLWSSSSQTNHQSFYHRLFRMSRLLDDLQLGLTHRSAHQKHLQTLIGNTKVAQDLRHPFMILADACEATGYPQRSQTGLYSSSVSLTTFNDALNCESELVTKLEIMPFNNQTFHDVFRTWSINHLRLRPLFDDTDVSRKKSVWVQDVELLSANLARVGQIGLKLLEYGSRRTFGQGQNVTIPWTLPQWIAHHSRILTEIENQVSEIRLAAVRPVRRLLDSVEKML